MAERSRRFIPAAGLDWLLPLYDPLLRLVGIERARLALVEQAAIAPGDRVLDIGCGTGSLSLAIARARPGAKVTGLDPDAKALARAERRAAREGFSVRFDRGFGDELPYPDASFERVVSSLVLHHLTSDEKRKTLAEARRALVTGGELHVLDFGGGQERADGLLARWLHHADHLHDNFGGRLAVLMREAGFAQAAEVGHRAMLFGRLAYYRAV
ncbi:class I SAM-dependent methyltransferase [Candidatus Binatia bacterium]|nr:class I SAM-dependent methyltransferase [Candidatus Binatia bacterium]